MEEGPATQEEGAREAKGRGQGSNAEVRVLGLEHVSITTPAELESEVIAWYRDCLKLEEMGKPKGTLEQGGWFRAGNQQVHVSIDEHNPPKKAHFGLVVNDFGDIVQRLREGGCHIEQATAIPGRHRFYTRDPAGNRIEIITFDEEATMMAFEAAARDDPARVTAEES